VLGPYLPFAGNPILTQRHLDPSRPHPVTSTGHADFVQTPNGDWWAVFLGARPYGDDLYNTGRETFLMPVHWELGWPMITRGNQTVPYLHKAPSAHAPTRLAMPTSGNFEWRDDFDENSLASHWNFIRTPRTVWHDLSSKPGWLTLRARPVDLNKRGQPSFMGRRQQHAYASVSTAMAYQPVRAGDKAGLVAFQNDEFYYFLGIGSSGARAVIEVERHSKSARGTESSVMASAPLARLPHSVLFLKIEARGALYDFSYAYAPGLWQPLVRGADGTLLSTKVAKGFVGTYFGLFAYSDAP
jgi:alpha-N-arabinofuranosidase